MLDIILIMMAFLSKRYIKYAIPSVVLSCMTYGRYLFFTADFGVWPSAVYLALWGFFTYEFVKNNKTVGAEKENKYTASAGQSGESKKIDEGAETKMRDINSTDTENPQGTVRSAAEGTVITEGN